MPATHTQKRVGAPKASSKLGYSDAAGEDGVKQAWKRHTAETSSLDILERCKKLNQFLSKDFVDLLEQAQKRQSPASTTTVHKGAYKGSLPSTRTPSRRTPSGPEQPPVSPHGSTRTLNSSATSSGTPEGTTSPGPSSSQEKVTASRLLRAHPALVLGSSADADEASALLELLSYALPGPMIPTPQEQKHQVEHDVNPRGHHLPEDDLDDVIGLLNDPNAGQDGLSPPSGSSIKTGAIEDPLEMTKGPLSQGGHQGQDPGPQPLDNAMAPCCPGDLAALHVDNFVVPMTQEVMRDTRGCCRWDGSWGCWEAEVPGSQGAQVDQACSVVQCLLRGLQVRRRYPLGKRVDPEAPHSVQAPGPGPLLEAPGAKNSMYKTLSGEVRASSGCGAVDEATHAKILAAWSGYFQYWGDRAVLVIQSYWRGWLARRRKHQFVQATVLLQCVWRCSLAQVTWAKHLGATRTVQQAYRALRARRLFKELRSRSSTSTITEEDQNVKTVWGEGTCPPICSPWDTPLYPGLFPSPNVAQMAGPPSPLQFPDASIDTGGQFRTHQEEGPVMSLSLSLSGPLLIQGCRGGISSTKGTGINRDVRCEGVACKEPDDVRTASCATQSCKNVGEEDGSSTSQDSLCLGITQPTGHRGSTEARIGTSSFADGTSQGTAVLGEPHDVPDGLGADYCPLPLGQGNMCGLMPVLPSQNRPNEGSLTPALGPATAPPPLGPVRVNSARPVRAVPMEVYGDLSPLRLKTGDDARRVSTGDVVFPPEYDPAAHNRAALQSRERARLVEHQEKDGRRIISTRVQQCSSDFRDPLEALQVSVNYGLDRGSKYRQSPGG